MFGQQEYPLGQVQTIIIDYNQLTVNPLFYDGWNHKSAKEEKQFFITAFLYSVKCYNKQLF